MGRTTSQSPISIPMRASQEEPTVMHTQYSATQWQYHTVKMLMWVKVGLRQRCKLHDRLIYPKTLTELSAEDEECEW